MTLSLSYTPIAPATPLTPIVPEIKLTSITIESKSNKKMYQRGPGQSPYIIDMGYQGPIYKITATIDSVDYAKWMTTSVIGIPSGALLTQTASTYDEFPSGGIFMLDNKSINRKGGTVDKWNLTITLVRTTIADFYYNGKA